MNGPGQNQGAFVQTNLLKSTLQHDVEPLALRRLDRAIGRAIRALLACQRADGHWIFELEADATIPSEYVLLQHFLGTPPSAQLEAKIAAYLRRAQGAHGGWPLFHGGEFDISASVKAYFALKVIGDAEDAEHMVRAREAIRSRGGAGESNVFTRLLLSLYGVSSWSATPVMPVEIMLLPKWFPAHLSKISYWARTVLVPLLVLQALKPIATNPRGTRIDELFVPGWRRILRRGPHQKWRWYAVFAAADVALRWLEPLFPKRYRRIAMQKAIDFVTERLNGEDGLGAIFPAMANALMMFHALGYPADHPHVVLARKAIEKLLVIGEEEAYCQPCVSPVWDTVLACHALMEAGAEGSAVRNGIEWLRKRQVLDVAGDWAEIRPHVRPGGWAFQYANPHYPDLDDTAVVVMALERSLRENGAGDAEPVRHAIERGREWVLGLQSRSGGWGAFDADNTKEYLNHIPFADHGALLDPPTEDVTGRAIGMLSQLGMPPDAKPIAAALRYLRRQQLPDGSWYGRWGMHYIYGTWSVLCAMRAAGVAADAPEIRRAVSWLVSIQNFDGGWGEGGESYSLDYEGHKPASSTASQTAWALLALMAAGESGSAVERGIGYLIRTQALGGLWQEERYTATGFPRVFFLRYHGYAKYFPLWALARYRNLQNGDYSERVGM
jgi:squalene-hopene/tetraprenyl-beta-curcumene cyclase